MNNEPELQQDPAPTPTPLSPTPHLSARDIDLGITPSPTPLPTPTLAPLPFIPEEPAMPTEPPKKSRKKMIVIIVALLLIGGAIGSYFLYFQPKPALPTATVSAKKGAVEVTKADTYSANTLIKEVRSAQAKLATTYPQSTVAVDEVKFSPAYKYGDSNYYIRGSFGGSIYVTDTSSNQGTDLSNDPLTKAAEAAALAVFDSHKSLIKSSTEYITTYQSDTAICTVSIANYPIVTNCADVKDYKAEAATIKPFADAYAKVTKKEYVSDTVFANPVTTQKSDGYANATVSMSPIEGVGGFAGLYYAKDGAWTYWTGTQALIDCTEYSSYALQKSFEGNLCYDAKTENENATVVVTLSK